MSVSARTRRGGALLPASVAALVAAAVAAGCGVPTGDNSFREVPPAEIQFGLNATSTSTTTTTTTTTTTLPEAPDTTALATTSTVRLEPVEIYFVTRGRLLPVVFELPPDSSPEQIAEVLVAGPPPPGVTLDTLIEEGLILSAVESGGLLTVDLDEETFDRIPATEQTEAIGQIVLTMISSLRRVGQVTFTLDGEPIAVKRGNSLPSAVGEELSYEDYSVLLVNTPTPDDTDGPDSATTTTSDVPAGASDSGADE